MTEINPSEKIIEKSEEVSRYFRLIDALPVDSMLLKATSEIRNSPVSSAHKHIVVTLEFATMDMDVKFAGSKSTVTTKDKK